MANLNSNSNSKSLRIRNEHLEQVVGTDVYKTSVADMQTRAIPVSRVFTTLPPGAIAGSQEGEYCLVGSSTPSTDAGLYAVNATKELERLHDFGDGTPMLTPVAALDLSTGDTYSLSPGVLGTKSMIGSGPLTVEKIPSSPATSLVTYADTCVAKRMDASFPGVRYLVDSDAPRDQGVWIGKGFGNPPVRAQDTDFVFEHLLVLVTDTGNQYIVTTTTAGKKPTDDTYTAFTTLKYSVTLTRMNHEVQHVVPFWSTLDIVELKARLGITAVTSTLTVLVLVVADIPANKGVYQVNDRDNFSRPSWWGGKDPNLGTRAGPDDMYNIVVYDMASSRYYENVATGRIDHNPSLWVVTLKPNTANRVYVTTMISLDTEPNNLPEFVIQSGLAPDFAIIYDTDTDTYRIFNPTTFVEWTVDDCRANHTQVFVNLNEHPGMFAVGDSFGFSNDPSPNLAPVIVSKESMLQERAVVYSPDPSDSVTSGALTVKGGVGVMGDVHANSLYADCDIRLKRDIRRIEGSSALGMVGALGAYEYSYLVGGGGGRDGRTFLYLTLLQSISYLGLPSIRTTQKYQNNKSGNHQIWEIAKKQFFGGRSGKMEILKKLVEDAALIMMQRVLWWWQIKTLLNVPQNVGVFGHALLKT